MQVFTVVAVRKEIPQLSTMADNTCYPKSGINVLHDFFKRLTVALEHREQKERQHREHHNKRRCARPERIFEHEKKRNADERAASEAEQLSFREIE